MLRWRERQECDERDNTEMQGLGKVLEDPVWTSSQRQLGTPDGFQRGRCVCVWSGVHELLGGEWIVRHKAGGRRTSQGGPSKTHCCARVVTVETERKERN